jgi:hypothetical protein
VGLAKQGALGKQSAAVCHKVALMKCSPWYWMFSTYSHGCCYLVYTTHKPLLLPSTYLPPPPHTHTRTSRRRGSGSPATP